MALRGARARPPACRPHPGHPAQPARGDDGVNGAALLVAVVLLLANAFFVAAEFSLIAARRTQIEHLASEGNARARMGLGLMRELSLQLAGAQLGITMA